MSRVRRRRMSKFVAVVILSSVSLFSERKEARSKESEEDIG